MNELLPLDAPFWAHLASSSQKQWSPHVEAVHAVVCEDHAGSPATVLRHMHLSVRIVIHRSRLNALKMLALVLDLDACWTTLAPARGRGDAVCEENL